MPKTTPKTLSLNIDGKTVDVQTDSAKAFELNKALTEAATFKEFAKDPQAIASKFGLKIDTALSHQLKSQLAGAGSLADVKAIMPEHGGAGATVWAVAGGAYSVSSSKIAVAF